MTGRVSFTGAKILAGEQFDLVEGATLNVAKGQILSIGDPEPGSTLVDMAGKLLCPMFINAHCHLGDTGLKELGLDLQMEKVLNPPDGLKHKSLNSLTKDELIRLMRHGLIEMLQNGIAACADFREQGLQGVQALRAAAEGLPIQVVILGRMAEDTSSQKILEEARSILVEADGIGVRDVESYPPEIIHQVRREYPDKILACHVSERRAAEADSVQRTGVGQTSRALEWMPDFLVHLVHTPVNELKAAAVQGVIGVSCPRSNAVLGDGLPNLAEWKKQNLSFCLGTDNMMFCAPNMLREMEITSRVTRGMEESSVAISAVEVLKAATINGARALKLDKDLGSLSPGKRASFIVFDLESRNLRYSKDWINAIVHRASLRDIDSIYVSGKLIEKDC